MFYRRAPNQEKTLQSQLFSCN